MRINAVEQASSLVGRTSWSAADALVGLPDCVANRASRTGTSGAAQESRPTLPSVFGKAKRYWLADPHFAAR